MCKKLLLQGTIASAQIASETFCLCGAAHLKKRLRVIERPLKIRIIDFYFMTRDENRKN
jgi:hypothetical protein